jgi:hypothetical protein
MQKEKKEDFLYVEKFRSAVFAFILFIILSTKVAYNIINMILTSVFNNIQLLNEKNEPNHLAIFINALLIGIFIF